MANYTTRLGRDAANAAQWGTKAGSLLGAVEIDYVSSGLNNRFAPAAFDVTRATSATRVNPSGLIEKVQANVPRICYLNDAKGELLVEPQRTNLITYSEEFDNAAWLKDSLTINSNQGIAPDGTSNSDLIIPNSTLGNRFIGRSATTGQNISSVFLKMKELRYVNFGNAAAVTTVDLQNGTISADVVSVNEFSIEDYGSGWYRVTCYNTISSNFQIQVFFGVDATGANITTNGTDGAYIWGAQLEQGGYPTSYIKTEASQVTRSADTATKNVSSFVTPTSGAMMVDVESILGLRDGGNAAIQLGATNGYLYIYDASNTNNGYLGVFVQSADGSVNSVPITSRSKVLWNWSSTNVDIWVDGVKQISTGKAFSLANTNLTLSGSNSKLFNLYTLALWDATLSDSEAQQITT